MTVSVSQNNSRVIGFPSLQVESRPGGTACYIQMRIVALRADPDVAAGRVFDGGQRIGADRARGYLLGVDALQPFTPVRPPRSLMLLRALEPVRQRDVLDMVVGPELVLARRWRVDHAGDMPGAGQHVFHRAAEKLRAVKHGIGRRDVILAGRQIVDRYL